VRINSPGRVCPIVFVPPLLGTDPRFITMCTVGALGPSHGVLPDDQVIFSSSGFASSGRSGASGGTGVAGEAETIESGGKTLAWVSGVSWCSRDQGEHRGIPEPASCLSLSVCFGSSRIRSRWACSIANLSHSYAYWKLPVTVMTW
jgi:hypothetical protein